MTRAYRNALPVQELGQVVGMKILQVEGEHGPTVRSHASVALAMNRET